MPRKKNEEENVEATSVEAAEEAPVALEASPASDEKPKRAPKTAEPKVDGNDGATLPSKAGKKTGKRAEKVGIVASDKMTKTVVVRVDRLVKHPVYRKYV